MILHQELQTLAKFSSTSLPAVTRILYSKEDLAAREYFKKLCREAGLELREDAIGNTFARWEGTDTSLPAVATGSHIDAIPHSGMYDGTVGVLGGLEAIRILQRECFKPRHPIELILFTAEEPTRFGIGCLGSRMLSGQLAPTPAAQLRDEKGRSLEEWRKKAGFKGSLQEVQLPKGHYHAFIELHIEQGPGLEARGIDIGIVEKIAAPSTLRVQLTGQGGHAGCVLMPDRRDAACAAAEIVLTVEAIAAQSPSPDTVATTGVLKIEPGAVNSIPKAAYLEIDLRDTQLDTRDQVLKELQRSIRNIGERRQIDCTIDLLNCDPPAICDSKLINTASQVVERLGFSYQLMISRAYHDTLFMAQICPVTMLFIPCREGVSHRPDEYSSPAQIDKGVETLAECLRELSS